MCSYVRKGSWVGVGSWARVWAWLAKVDATDAASREGVRCPQRSAGHGV